MLAQELENLTPKPAMNSAKAVQDEICEVLNNTQYFQDLSVTFIPECALDLQYQVKDALARQSLAATVITPNARYIGHDGLYEQWQFDPVIVRIFENPLVSREMLSVTNLDIAFNVAEALAGPQSGRFGDYCPRGIDTEEYDAALLKTDIKFATTIRTIADGMISSTASGRVEIPFAFRQELTALEAEFADLSSSTITTDDLSDYVKQDEISDFVISSDLSDYAKKSDISDFIISSDLSDYAKKNDLSVYALSSDLTAYAKQTDLDELSGKTVDISVDVDAISANVSALSGQIAQNSTNISVLSGSVVQNVQNISALSATKQDKRDFNYLSNFATAPGIFAYNIANNKTNLLTSDWQQDGDTERVFYFPATDDLIDFTLYIEVPDYASQDQYDISWNTSAGWPEFLIQDGDEKTTLVAKGEKWLFGISEIAPGKYCFKSIKLTEAPL